MRHPNPNAGYHETKSVYLISFALPLNEIQLSEILQHLLAQPIISLPIFASLPKDPPLLRFQHCELFALTALARLPR